MAKVTVKFSKTWKNYVSGDVASFEPDLAEKLIDAKVAKAHDLNAASEAPEPLSDAELASLTEREGALKALEARLAKQEADLAKREADLAEATPAATDGAEATPAATEAGAPPKQGKR